MLDIKSGNASDGVNNEALSFVRCDYLYSVLNSLCSVLNPSFHKYSVLTLDNRTERVEIPKSVLNGARKAC